MPCWGTRERLLFAPSAAETTISQCIALHCITVRCSAVPCTAERPILSRAGVPAAAWDQALTPRQTSTEQPHIPAESACQEALGTERKRPRTESWSRQRLPNGGTLRGTPAFLSTIHKNNNKLLISAKVYFYFDISAYAHLQLSQHYAPKLFSLFAQTPGMYIIINLG